MSIKCSLLGHRFDETSVERDREEDGTEVVITITELETCSRCGETRVVSENKEVTTMEAPGTDPDAGRGGSARRADPDEPADYDPEADDAEILDDAAAEGEAQATARGAAIPDAEAAAGPGGDPGGNRTDDGPDDAVIIDGEDDSRSETRGGAGGDRPAEAGADRSGAPRAEQGTGGAAGGGTGEGRQPGDWPEEDPDPAPAGNPGGEPFDDDRAGEWPDNGSGEWPEEPDGDASEGTIADWPEEPASEPAGEGDVHLEESASPTITVPEGMFKCSTCGFTTEVAASSLRAGDFCPECHRGTLVQHTDDGGADD